MKTFSLKIFIALFLLSNTRCIEPFETGPQGFDDRLVVEGFLSDVTKQHQVLLTRTSPLDSNERRFETGAQVRIEEEGRTSTTFQEVSPGVYLSPQTFRGFVGNTYQLIITTQDERQYQSTPVTLKATPPIDRVYAEFLPESVEQEAGIHIYLDTEDPTANTRFYRWEFDETYEIRPPFPSTYLWTGGNSFVFREPSVVGLCWRTDPSQNILVQNTTNLVRDAVNQFELRFIPEESFIMRYRYSMLVRQFALNAETYLFWEALRELSETQGSLFDIQPGTIPGNIFSIDNPDELVLGYFDASQTSERRVFFTPQSFTPQGYIRPDYLETCEENIEDVPVQEIGAFMSTENNFETKEIWAAFGFAETVFRIVPRECGNCTDIGTTERPDFW